MSVMLGGCATNTAPVTNLYTINISCEIDQSSEIKAKPSKVIKVLKTKSSAAIMSRHILYQEKDFAQNPYAHSRWSDTPNKMLDNLFLSCVNKSSIFNAVLPSDSKGKADFLLESRLTEFYHHVNSDGRSEGRVRLKFYLIESKNGNVAATNEFFSKVGSTTLDAKGGVRALSEASASIALSLAKWLSSLDNLIIQ